MDGTFSVPDSTDWLATPLRALAPLENLLHCQVCKEFYDTPMLTTCSHTFCSKCIRTCLSADGRCPACRAADQAGKLRNNWVLQEVVAAFVAARPAVLDLARTRGDAAAPRPGKRKRTAALVLETDDHLLEADTEEGRKPTRARRSQRLASSQLSEPDAIVVVDEDNDDDDDADGDGDGDGEGDGDFEPAASELDDGLVDCPLGCGKRMKIEAVEPHLDRCEDEKREAAAAVRRPKSSSAAVNGHVLGGSRSASSRQRGGSKPQERLAELNYSLLNDAKMRQKLRELGLPNWGGKQLMVKRHIEWANLWNANCDSNQPRTKRELLHDLDTWERTQGGRAPITNGVATTVMKKDFDGLAWADRNRDDFSRLIADARRTKAVHASEPSNDKLADAPTEQIATPSKDQVQHASAQPPVPNGSALQETASEPPTSAQHLDGSDERAGASHQAQADGGTGSNADWTSNSDPTTSLPSPLPSQPPQLPQPTQAQSGEINGIDTGTPDQAFNSPAGSASALPSALSSPAKRPPMFALPNRIGTDNGSEVNSGPV